MPPTAQGASAAPRLARAGASRSRRPSRHAGQAAGVRWDRVGRLAMLCLAVALLYLYLSAGLHMFSTWREARRDSGAVTALKHEHAELVRAHASLGRQSTIEAQARKLGMIRPGEQPYIISGLPRR